MITGTTGLVLDLEPDLAADLSDEAYARARPLVRGEILSLPPGLWEPDLSEGQIGFVLIAGMVCRELALRDHHMLELLGPGDVVIPADDDRGSLTGSSTVLAAVQGLIGHVSRAEHRLLLMLWHLADRWGRMTPQGALLPMPLTHSVLGQLASARRPTVSLGLASLESSGFVNRAEDGWIVTPLGARMVETLTRTRANAPSLSVGLMLRQRSTESVRAAKAVMAQSRQVRGQRES